MFSSRFPCSQVKWETGVLRQAFFSPMKYVVLATDYSSKALVCSCQDLSVAGFGGLNRRSCDFLVVSLFRLHECTMHHGLKRSVNLETVYLALHLKGKCHFHFLINFA